MTLPRLLLAVLAAAAAATAAILLNLLLLGSAAAQNDPVGRLTPRANLPAAPRWTIRPAGARVERDGADD
jgi:hypothetical protein